MFRGTLKYILPLVLAALLPACGSSPDASTASPTPQASPTPPPPAPPGPSSGLGWRAAVALLGNQVVARGVAPGPDGSFFVTGSFGASAPLQLGSLQATSLGGDDIFVARVQANGTPVWLASFGGTAGDTAFDIDADSNGFAYVTGIATGNVTFGSQTVNAGDGDAVTFKIDRNGTVVWVRTASGTGNSAGNEIAVRPDGEVAIVGPYTGATTFASDLTLPTTPSGRDLFVAAYGPNGEVRWARPFIGPDPGGSTSEAARGVAFDASGQRVLVTGVFTGSLSVPTDPRDTASIPALTRSGTNPACFVAAFADTAELQSLRQIGDGGQTICRGVTGDSFGQIQVAGKFTGTLFASPNQLTSAGAEDIFLATLSPDGTVEFARRIGGTGDDEGAEIEDTSDSEPILFGDYTNNATLPGGQTLTAAGGRDLLLARFNVAGSVSSFLTGGGAGNDTSFALALQPDGTIATVGTFAAPAGASTAQATFGSIQITSGTTSQAAFLAIAGPTTTGSAPPPPPPPPPTGTGLNISAAAQYAIDTRTRGLVIWQNGSQIFEQYGNGGAADLPELLASGSKSFSCVYAAAAAREGIIPDFNVLASTRLTPWAPGGSAPNNNFKQAIRVRDLLDLSSGLSTAGASGLGLDTVDSYAQAVNVRSSFPANQQIVYTPNHFQAFFAFFELATGGQLEPDGGVTGGRDPAEFLQTVVLNRIGATVSDWRRDASGNPILAGGAFMTARDWARYGQLVLQNGVWEGQQILPANIMTECKTPQTPAAGNIYGLGWWLNLPAQNFNPREDSIPLQPAEEERLSSGGNFIPTAPNDLFYARGAGNMKLFIIPSRNLVIARQGGATDDVEFFRLLFQS